MMFNGPKRELWGGLLIALLMGCAADPKRAEQAAPIAQPRPETTQEEAPLPAGLWMFEPVDATACIDCPSPRYAWLLASGDDATMRSALASWSKRHSFPPGYPFGATAAELGLAAPPQTLRLIGGLYHTRAGAEAAAKRGGHVIQLPQRRDAAALRALRLVDEQPKAYDPALLTLLERGLQAQAHPKLLAKYELPSCGLERGASLLIRPEQLISIPDMSPWVQVRCPNGARAAVISIHSTTLDLTTMRGEEGATITYQPAGGICGVARFRRVTYAERVSARTLDVSPSCVQETKPGSDPWQRCQGDLLSCVQRAQARADGGDPAHGLRLASYACRFGAMEGCDLSARLAKDSHRAILPRLEACERGDQARCRTLDQLLGQVAPEPGRDHGMVAVIACRRGHKAWCEALKDSPYCDEDGCG